MLNKDKYAKELEQILVDGDVLAFYEKCNEVLACRNISCKLCKFYVDEGCAEKRKEWLNSEYVEPVDWSKVPVDTPILYTTLNHNKSWLKGYFAKFEDGKVYTWAYGRTSWSDDGDDNCNICERVALRTDEDLPETEKQWHNLKDWRPEDSQEVLVWADGYAQQGRWSDDAECFEYIKAEEIWWMELPEPPKKENLQN